MKRTTEERRLEEAGAEHALQTNRMQLADSALADALEAAISGGTPATTAAELAGIPRHTVYKILKRAGFDFGPRSDAAREAAILRHSRDREQRKHSQGTSPVVADDGEIDLLQYLKRRAGVS